MPIKQGTVASLTKCINACQGNKACVKACEDAFVAAGGKVFADPAGGKVFADPAGGKVFTDPAGGKVFTDPK